MIMSVKVNVHQLFSVTITRASAPSQMIAPQATLAMKQITLALPKPHVMLIILGSSTGKHASKIVLLI